MDKEDILIITQIVAEIMEVDEEQLTTDITLHELGADELDMVEIMMAIEDDMEIEFPDNSMLVNPEKDKRFSIDDIIKITEEIIYE